MQKQMSQKLFSLICLFSLFSIPVMAGDACTVDWTATPSDPTIIPGSTTVNLAFHITDGTTGAINCVGTISAATEHNMYDFALNASSYSNITGDVDFSVAITSDQFNLANDVLTVTFTNTTNAQMTAITANLDGQRFYDDTDTKDAGAEMFSVGMIELAGWIGLIILGFVLMFLITQWKPIFKMFKK